MSPTRSSRLAWCVPESSPAVAPHAMRLCPFPSGRPSLAPGLWRGTYANGGATRLALSCSRAAGSSLQTSKPLIWFRSHTACPQAKYAERQKWSRLLQAIKLAAERVEKLAAGINQADTRDVDTADAPDVEQATAPSTKRRRMLPDGALNAWRALHAQAHAVENQVRC